MLYSANHVYIIFIFRDTAEFLQPCQTKCQHTSCSACRFVSAPSCRRCKQDDFRCLRKFGKCVRKDTCSRRKFPCKEKYFDVSITHYLICSTFSLRTHLCALWCLLESGLFAEFLHLFHLSQSAWNRWREGSSTVMRIIKLNLFPVPVRYRLIEMSSFSHHVLLYLRTLHT